MFGKLFQRSSGKRPDDEFGLLELCEKTNLSDHSDTILKACRRAVEISLEQFNPDLPHTASRLGGCPALPDDFPWPSGQDENPMTFIGQLTCQELRLAKYEGVPEEGLISLFIDTLEDEPTEAQVYHFSLKRDLVRRPTPGKDGPPPSSYRPGFRAIPSLPALVSKSFTQLNIDSQSRDDYEELLDLLSERRDPSSLQLGGYAPYWDSECSEPGDESQKFSFFLGLHDIEELSVTWEPSGTAYLWLPEAGFAQADITTELSWQVCEEDEDWDDDDDDDDDEEWEDED